VRHALGEAQDRNWSVRVRGMCARMSACAALVPGSLLRQK
jgi:hypothetical protein